MAEGNKYILRIGGEQKGTHTYYKTLMQKEKQRGKGWNCKKEKEKQGKEL